MRRSEPLDLDPAAEIEPLCHSNLVRSLQIRRLRCVWEQVGDGTRRRSDHAAARGSGLPDFTVSGHPGFNTALFWVMVPRHETCTPPVLFVRGYGILGGLRSVGGGSAVAELAGVRALARG